MNIELKSVLDRVWYGEESALAELREEWPKSDERLESLLVKVRQKDEKAFADLTETYYVTWMLNAIRAGNEDAFTELYHKYFDLVHGILKFKKLPPDEIENAIQDIFIKLNQSDLKGKFLSFGHLKSYIARAAFNRANDFYRNPWRRAASTIDNSDDPHMTISDPSRSAEDTLINREIIDQSLLTLTDGEKETALLFHIDGFSYDEIAAIQQTTEGAVRGKLANVRKKWRKLWSEEANILIFGVSFLNLYRSIMELLLWSMENG